MPPRVTAPKHMPAQPRSHTPTALRPLVGNSDTVLTALVAVKRVKRTAFHGDIYNSILHSTDNNKSNYFKSTQLDSFDGNCNIIRSW